MNLRNRLLEVNESLVYRLNTFKKTILFILFIISAIIIIYSLSGIPPASLWMSMLVGLGEHNSVFSGGVFRTIRGRCTCENIGAR